MKFAVIAAGEGSRLSQEGVETPKPLIRVGGEPMIDRLCRIFVNNGATEIIVVVNEESRLVREHLEQLPLPVPLRVVVRTTQSSMHSFHAVAPYLKGEAFCLTTVDTVFREKDFASYIRYFNRSEVDGCMAVTSFVDDEKPLFVETDAYNRIVGFHDEGDGGKSYVSGGIYCLRPKALDVLDDCVSGGLSRMRNYQRRLVEEGLQLMAFPFDKIVDVDHKEDIRKANAFLREKALVFPVRVVGVSRGSQYSPNLVGDDAAILEAVARKLSANRCLVEVYSEADFVENRVSCDVLFSMARDYRTLLRLQELERDGACVVNSGFGIANCIRLSMTEILIRNGIPHPASRVIWPGEPFPQDIPFPCWVKRGDSSALVKEDVSFIRNREEAERLLSRFDRRGIRVAVVNEHLPGDVVKFYGVQGTGFFHWFYPSMTGHTKFGLEAVNGEAKGFAFSVEKLKQYADKAALALKVPVYGGDCVIGEDGTIRIFDFNDWPSFAPCREEAAEHIATYILKKISRLNEEDL